MMLATSKGNYLLKWFTFTFIYLSLVSSSKINLDKKPEQLNVLLCVFNAYRSGVLVLSIEN